MGVESEKHIPIKSNLHQYEMATTEYDPEVIILLIFAFN